MKHRGSGKIKMQHRMIQGLRQLLESIESWPEIRTIIPAVIRRTRGAGGELRLKVQYATPTGLKCIASRSGTAQEVFIVTADPQTVMQRLSALAE
jgi:hypothetical protein